MLSYEILGSIACDGDQKASEAIMENVKTDIAGISCFVPLDWVGNNGEVVYAALDALNSLTGSFLVEFVRTIDVSRASWRSRVARQDRA